MIIQQMIAADMYLDNEWMEQQLATNLLPGGDHDDGGWLVVVDLVYGHWAK